MNSSLNRAQREDRIREITDAFRSSRLFRNRPRPREDVKPRIAEALATLIESRSMEPGGLVSSGLIRSALQELEWRVSDSTVSTVLWHLSRNQMLEYDGLYYKIPARIVPKGRPDLAEAVREWERLDRERAAFPLITAVGRCGSDAGPGVEVRGPVTELLGKDSEKNYALQVHLACRNEKDSRQNLVLTHRILAREYFYWKAGLCESLHEELGRYLHEARRAARKTPFVFRPGQRKKWNAPDIEEAFRRDYRRQFPDGLLMAGPFELRTKFEVAPAATLPSATSSTPHPSAVDSGGEALPRRPVETRSDSVAEQDAGLQAYGVEVERRPSPGQLCMLSAYRSGTENVMAHIVLLDAAPGLVLELSPPRLRLGRETA